MKKVLKEPSEKLRMISDPVKRFTGKSQAKLSRLYCDMRDVFQNTNAIGLSAIQLGAPVRMIFMQEINYLVKPGGPKPFLVMINPEIMASIREDVGPEECLSCPGKSVRVWRAIRILVSWYNLGGTLFQRWFDGLESRIIQHEIDHLDGKLITDYDMEGKNA